MNTKVVSSGEATLHLHNLCNSKKPTTQLPKITPFSDSIRFCSQVVQIQSRISVQKTSGPCRPRSTARISAFYAPTAESSRESLYELLGITKTESTSPSEIKKAYKKMARKYHPDVSPPERVDEYTRRFIMVHEAYETLSNPKTRASYDRDLSSGRKPRTVRYADDDGADHEEWRMRWQSQLDGLKSRRGKGSGMRMSWGARMRSQS